MENSNKVSVRIKFSADLVIEADSLKQAKEKWESMPLFSKEAYDCYAEYIETLLIEEHGTYNDLTEEWEKV